MNDARAVCWQEGQFWLGYFEQFLDYWTQGESLEGLREHLRSLFEDLTSGEIPGVRHFEELVIA